jgi:tetratricopeptide (TPR) repeat protein
MPPSEDLRPPHRRTARLWRLMAALTHDPSEAFEGHGILREVPGEFGVVLWQAVRDVMMWAVADDRARLFAPGAGARRRALLGAAEPPEALDAALGVLTGLAAFPEEASPDAVSLACGRVARWAEACGTRATALAFAQAAALVLPHHSAAALDVGRLAVARGDSVRGEVWLRRAVGLARRDGDAVAGALAYAELGDLYTGTGDERRARDAFVRAMRLARRRGVYVARGRAFYGLGELERRAGRDGEAERLLRASWRPLGEGHPLRTRVSFALAELAIRQGRPAAVVEPLTRLLIATDAPAERLRAVALLALCAAHVGNRPQVARLWAEGSDLAERVPPSADRVLALLDLSRAAALARNRAGAHAAATRAHATAEHIGAPALAAEAARLRDPHGA